MKFGVEFECNYPQFIKRKRSGLIYFDDTWDEYDEGYKVDYVTTLNNDLKSIFPKWYADIHCDGEEDDNFEAWEFRTPPLLIGGRDTRQSFGKLKNVYKLFKKTKAKGYPGCGIHIHISMSDNWRKIRDEKAGNFLNFLCPRQDIFYLIGDKEREFDGMCNPVDYGSYGSYGDKYYGVNFHESYPTIEFRYFPSLPDIDTLKTWIMLCAETVKIGYGKEHKRIGEDWEDWDDDNRLSVDEMIKPYSKQLRKKLIDLMDRGKNPDKFYYREVK